MAVSFKCGSNAAIEVSFAGQLQLLMRVLGTNPPLDAMGMW